MQECLQSAGRCPAPSHYAAVVLLVVVAVAAGQHHNTTPGLPAAGAGAGAGAAPTIIIIQYLGCLAGGLATCTTATSPGSCTVQYRGSALYRGHRRHLWPPPDCAPDTEYLHLEEAEWLLLAAAW